MHKVPVVEVEDVRQVLAAAAGELAETRRRHAAELAEAVAARDVAQAAVDGAHRARLSALAEAWQAHAEELTEAAREAGDATVTVEMVRLKPGFAAEPYQEVQFVADQLTREASAAFEKAAWLRGCAAPGGQQSGTLARVVDDTPEPEKVSLPAGTAR